VFAVQSIVPYKPVSYADVAQFYLGSKGRVAIDIGLLSAQLGACCVYFIFLGANLQSLDYLFGVSFSKVPTIAMRNFDVAGIDMLLLACCTGDMDGVLCWASRVDLFVSLSEEAGSGQYGLA
jgi:hypothetical protein